MRLTGQRATSKRSGTTLKVGDIDASRRTNAHRRSESMKDFMHNVKKVAIVSSLVAIPAIYAIILVASWDTTQTRDEWLKQGLGALIAFALGKANFDGQDKEVETA